MSHLQPKFIAKAKTSLKGSQKPRAMPRSMIVDVARSAPCVRSKRPRETQGFWYTWGLYYPDYRIFSLKK